MTDPSQVQAQINAVSWTNGRGLVTGASIFARRAYEKAARELFGEFARTE